MKKVFDTEIDNTNEQHKRSMSAALTAAFELWPGELRICSDQWAGMLDDDPDFVLSTLEELDDIPMRLAYLSIS